MRRYRLTGLVTISVTTTVEAESKEEALRVGLEDTPMSPLTFPYESCDDSEEWVAEELDGEVKEVVEVRELFAQSVGRV